MLMLKSKLPTLDEFLKREHPFPNSSYVKEKGFKQLYVRDTFRYISPYSKVSLCHCIDIAYIIASYPGKGAFTKLIQRLNKSHNIYVECVQMDYFKHKLLRMGFKEAVVLDSFYLLKGELINV